MTTRSVWPRSSTDGGLKYSIGLLVSCTTLQLSLEVLRRPTTSFAQSHADTSANGVGRRPESVGRSRQLVGPDTGLLAPHCQFIRRRLVLARSPRALWDLLSEMAYQRADGRPKSRYGLGISCRHKSASCTTETQFTGSDLTRPQDIIVERTAARKHCILQQRNRRHYWDCWAALIRPSATHVAMFRSQPCKL